MKRLLLSSLQRQRQSQSHHATSRRNTGFRFLSTSKPGLFSIPELQHPSDFFKLTKEAILKSDALRDSIPHEISSQSHAVEVLYQLDHISRSVCNVIDAAELCRSAHASEEWRLAASQAFEQLQTYIGSLNADDRLFQALAKISKRTDFSAFQEEEQRFCTLLQREFELDRIHLPGHERRHVQELHHRVSQLETLFANNITHASKPFWVQASDAEKVLPRNVLEDNGAVYQEDKVQLHADTPITHSLASFANDAPLRQHIHMETTTKCPENLEVLDAMIAARHELAQALGFPSFAHRFLRDKMAGSPQAVGDFLRQLETNIRPNYQKELAWISQAKQQLEGTPEVQPWDIKFYVKMLKAQIAGVDPHELTKYWSLSNCLTSLQLLSKELFGIEMHEETEISLEERWDLVDGHTTTTTTGTTTTIPTGDDAIRKFTFLEIDTQRPLGTMYLDLHPRQGKYTHAAHFTVRCGCVVDGPNSNEYQLPIVALVCNMNLFSSHQEVETLFHEFGHALHSLLSRTNFQHLSGTRGAMDFVETPSHWMEHFVWDPDFLQILARDPEGNPMPQDKIQALVASRTAFRCLEMQNQILLSSFDQEIFGANYHDSGSSKSTSSSSTPLQIWEGLHQQHHVPYAQGTHWYSNVGHLVTYGAGYYGYLYSQVFANAIWGQLFQNQCLNRDSGDRIWKKVLIHGGARDANVMLEDLLGKKPTVEIYWKSLQ
jgi:intermediate peptidase